MARYWAAVLLWGSIFAVASAESEKLAYQWVAFGLEGRRVLVLDQSGTTLLAGTDDGLYRYDLATDSGWSKIDLPMKFTQGLFVHSANPSIIFAGWGQDPVTHTAPPSTADTLFKSTDGGKTWSAPCSAIKGIPIERVTGNPANVNEWFFTSSLSVYQSADGGASWVQRTSGEGMGLHVIVADPMNAGQVYAGGESSLFSPILKRSTDIKNSVWQNLFGTDYTGDNAVYSIVIDPKDPKVMLAGMECKIFRTLDHGATHEYLQAVPVYFYIAIMDPREPRRMFLGGVDRQNTGHFKLYWSPDRARNCQSIDAPTTSAAMCMILNKKNPSIGYVGTYSGGVFKLTSHLAGSTAMPAWKKYE